MVSERPCLYTSSRIRAIFRSEYDGRSRFDHATDGISFLELNLIIATSVGYCEQELGLDG